MTTISQDQEAAYPSLLTALEERDFYTKGHCDRVQKLALEMGAACRLHATDLEILRIASLLHDVGKIGVRDAALLKPGKFTPEEWKEMQSHSIHGERIINSTFLSNKDAGASVVRHHHEAFDGSGYPDGIAGNEIPLNCRILLIVDSYDAMTTGRAYHKARTHSEAMEILSKESGTKLDPEVFAIFSKVIAISSAQIS